MATNKKALEKCLITAKSYGVPRDQAKNFVSVGYIPLPWQWEFHAEARRADKDGGPVDIGLGGARGPGKSHAVLSQAVLDDCQRIPNLKGLFLRQTGLAAKESFDDLVDKVLRGKVEYTKTGFNLVMTNGSKVLLGGFKDQSDIDKYIGIEYDFIIVEELNQLDEDRYVRLRGSLRTSKADWRPRMYTSFNPGGRGHEFVKQRYVMPFREKRQEKTRFIGSTYKSNPYLNKEYIEYLEDLEGDLGEAWREGEWDLFAGQVFNEFRRKTHVIKQLTPKKSLSHFLWTDWGYTAPFAAYATALVEMKAETGEKFNRLITYQEWYDTGKYPEEWAEHIYKTARQREFRKWVVDPAMMNTQTDGSMDIATTMTNKWKNLNKGRNWISPTRGNNKRASQVPIMKNWMSLAPDGMAYWLITEECVNMIRTLPTLTYDEHRVEEIDTTGADHASDAASYGLKEVKWISVKAGAFGAKPQARKYEVMADMRGDKQVSLNPDLFMKRGRKKKNWRTI